MRRLAIAAILGSALILSACGQQADDRAASGSETVDMTVEEPAQEEAAGQAPLDTPYVTLDCTSLQVMPVDTPPEGATQAGDAYAIFQPNGAPALTIATQNTPATELSIADIREGDGAQAQPGDTVTVNYCGAGYGGLSVFDSSWSRGEPIAFPLASLIPGWQEGIPGMKVGGQRLLVIPGALAYGEMGTSGIAPNETLAFVIELLDTAS